MPGKLIKIIMGAMAAISIMLTGCEVHIGLPAPDNDDKAAPSSGVTQEEKSTDKNENAASDEILDDTIPYLDSRYFLRQLSGNDRIFCSLVYSGVMSMTDSIEIPKSLGISFDRADVLIQTVMSDCPELFMCSGGYALHGTANVGSVKFEYRMTGDEYSAAADEIAEIIDAWREDTSGMSAYQTELFVHDAICAMCTYNTDGDFCDTAYGTFVDGHALCQGYSKAFQMAMQQLDFCCMFVSSRKMVHGWNVVCLDGAYYQVDVTWDDTDDEECYAYFNLSDAQMEKLSHSYDETLPLNYPVCDSNEYNYYVFNGDYIPSQDNVHTEFLSRLDRAYASGGGEITVMFEDASQLAELADSQSGWISEWNSNKYLNITFSQRKLDNNDYIYIGDFKFE